MAAQSSVVPLKEYLKRYQACTEEPKKAKKKKKEKSKPQSTGWGVHVVDEDPVWQKPVQDVDEDDENPVGDETPQIEEDIEVKRMKRLETLRSLKPYHGISEDGSGWVQIPPPSRPSTTNNRSLSPQQSQHNSRNTGISPNQRRQCFDSPYQSDTDEKIDLSPPRKRRGRLDTPSPEPQFNGTGRAAGDLSPPRRQRVKDLSPPRRSKVYRQEPHAGRGLPVTDRSPTRKSWKGPAEDLSPPRQYKESTEANRHQLNRNWKGSSEDLSPPRQTRKSPAIDLSPRRRTKKESPGGLTKEARKGGLLSAKEMKEEIDKKKKDEKSRFASMDPLLTGIGAEAVHRDKEGRRISKEDLNKPVNEKKEPKPLEWGKGLAQRREAEGRGKELELEKSRPFARSRDDAELNTMLKERIRWGDPMAHLVKQKNSELILEDFGENEKMKESGFVIPQTIPKHSWLKRGLDFLPNRFGIRPGRHWDGVDRSNGYEKELFKRQNEKRATESEAYLWSVSDM